MTHRPRPNTGAPPVSRLAPAAPDAERALIGALLIEGDGDRGAGLVARCAELISDESFSGALWAAAWRSIYRRSMEGGRVDLVLVLGDMELDADLEALSIGPADIAANLTGAMAGGVLSFNAPDYALQVLDAHLKRRAIDTAATVAAMAYRHTGTAAELQEAIGAEWAKLDVLVAESESGDLGPVFAGMYAEAEAGTPIGRSTGMACLDEWIGGAVPGHIWVLGGYTAVGKSWTACTIANGLIDAGARVGFISLEMPASELSVRLLAGRVGPSSAYRFKRKPGQGPATWTPAERAALAEAQAILARHLKIYERVRSLDAIRSVARRNSFDALIVDYGQLIEVQGARGEYEINTAAARGLQALAKTARCTVIALSQISQASARMGGDDAVLGFKASGAWSEVADLGLMLRREDKDRPELLTLSAVKNRHGQSVAGGAVATLRMDKATGLLTELRLPPQTAPSSPAPVQMVVPRDWTNVPEEVDDDDIPAEWR